LPPEPSCIVASLASAVASFVLSGSLEHRAPPRHQPYTRRMADDMLIVTQVAPYVDGPAGVHGTLPQAEIALAELAEMHGLSPLVVDDVRDLPPGHLSAARVLALFTIGETPWTEAQKDAVHAAWASGELRLLGVHSASDA